MVTSTAGESETVLGLGEQVDGAGERVGVAVGEDEDLRGPGQRLMPTSPKS